MGIIARLLLIAAILLSDPALAARGFGSTLGSGSTDKIATNYSTAFTTQYSISFWVNIHGIGGGTFGRMVGVGTAPGTGDVIGLSNSTTLMTSRALFSTTQAIWTWTGGSADTWQNIVYTYDASSVSNVPTVYINGSSVSVTTFTPPVGTYAPSATNFIIGNDATNVRNLDGQMAEVAYWSNTILTANEARALSQGYSPLKIRNSSLVLYYPLYGVGSTEPAWGSTHSTQTITGTLFRNHPSVSGYPVNPIRQ